MVSLVLITVIVGAIIFFGFAVMNKAISDPERKDKMGIVGQWVGGAISGARLGYEIAVGADIGFVMITLGSIIFAGATKLRKI